MLRHHLSQSLPLCVWVCHDTAVAANHSLLPLHSSNDTYPLVSRQSINLGRSALCRRRRQLMTTPASAYSDGFHFSGHDISIGRGWGDRGGGGSANSCLNMIGDKRSAKMATAQFDTCNEEERQYYGNLRLQVDESWLRLLLIFLKSTY